MTQEYYALGSDRSANAVRAFLERFLPNRESCIGEYWIPEHSDAPCLIIKDEDTMLDYMEAHSQESFGLYWNDKDNTSFAQAMVFYTRDGLAIYGLADEAEDVAGRMIELAEAVGARYFMLGSEQRPPDTAAAFIAMCRSSGWHPAP